MKKRGFRYCLECKNKLKKRGKTAAGKQRWYCRKCDASSTRPRPDVRRGFVLEKFVSWLLGNSPQHELSAASRTFRAQTVWCWDAPLPSVVSGEIHHCIIVDGIKVGGQVCLIARTVHFVVAWVWVPYESSAYWSELCRPLPAPDFVVCDGQKGLSKALALCWPDVTVQRCRFHAWLNVKAKLTLHPESRASQELLDLARRLLKVQTRRQARRWKQQLKNWHRRHERFINERTIKHQAKPGERRWRYTHERLRSAYRQLNKFRTICFVPATDQAQTCLARQTTLKAASTAKFEPKLNNIEV